jgi:hypothetical protein
LPASWTTTSGVAVDHVFAGADLLLRRHCDRDRSLLLAPDATASEALIEAFHSAGLDEIHYSKQPMGQQFRIASERQADSSRVLA